jgi:hypothetical protein
VFLALHAGIHALNIIVTDDCPPAPDGRDRCQLWFPGFGVVSILGGWESRSTSLRLLGGPAFVASEEKTAGFVGRIDAATPSIGRLSAVASISSLFVPSHKDDRFLHTALAIGLRVR